MSEIRALLLTDVVNSTQLSEALGDAAIAEVWAAHDRIARTLLPEWHGREIDKTDGMLLMFDTAADAVGYALAYHRSLAELPVALQARAGLHVGPVVLRENNAADVALGAKPLEVDGLAKPTAARVMSLARGGQTLMTSEARWALGATRARTESHGHWLMRGISEPVELFEVGEANATFSAPAGSEKVYHVVRSGDRWLPVVQVPNNLPLQVTSFIGRERELDEVKALLAKARLLTLLGMGGLGKTRVSLQVAAELMAEYPDGVWFLDLASIRDPALVVSEAAQVLGLREEADRTLIRTVCAHLASRQLLLVFDNCEHLIKASAELANAILRAAPRVRVLASSRHALHVPGEQIYPILPLPVPKHGDDFESLSRSTAVRLFVERARLHRPTFALNEREAPAVVELVARLEGIPLALELAAARVRSLTVADINARLKDRYKLLTGGSGVLQERQQTLRALVDWSYELLTDAEQTVLQRLAVFVGGFDLAAAEKVCGAEPLEEFDVLDLLGSLIEKSLVMLDEREECARYRMLETIRDYAREKLEAGGELQATRGAPLRALLRDGQGCQCRLGGFAAGGLGLACRNRTRQHAQRDGAGAGRRRGLFRRRQVRRRDAGLLDLARLLDRRPQAGQSLTCNARDPGIRYCPGVGLVRRRRTRRESKRLRRSPTHAGDMPGTAAPAREPDRHCSNLVDLVTGLSEGRRCGRCGCGRA